MVLIFFLLDWEDFGFSFSIYLLKHLMILFDKLLFSFLVYNLLKINLKN